MKRASLILAALALPTVLLKAASVLTYGQAVKEARTDGRSLIILCIGSGWMKNAQQFKEAFAQAAAADAGAGTAWALYDLREDLDGAGRKALGTLPLEIYGYPAWIFADCKGRPLAHKENIALLEIKTLPATVKMLALKCKRRDIALAKAESAAGLEKAVLIGRALSETLDPVIERFPFRITTMYFGRYRDLVNQIKKADPEDRSGYGFKYTFWFQPVMEGVIKKNNAAKAFDKNYAYVREKLASAVLTPRQRQQLVIFNYTTAMDAGDLKAAMSYLDEAAAISPKSDLAADCHWMKRYYTEPVVLAGPFWRPTDNRPRWTPMKMDASAFIHGPGVYSVEFRHSSGRTKFRNPVLCVNNTTVASAQGEKTAFELAVSKLPAGRVQLVVEAMGTGWFSGKGDIIIRRK